MVKNNAAALWMLALMLVAACDRPAPTATPTEILATRPQDLAGVWFDGEWYHRFDADGTIRMVASMEDLDDPNYRLLGHFWFEDGTYHERNAFCLGIYVYEVHLRMDGGRAVGLRMTLIEEGDPPCVNGRLDPQMELVRVD
jgi:hypothetical protein